MLIIQNNVRKFIMTHETHIQTLETLFIKNESFVSRITQIQ